MDCTLDEDFLPDDQGGHCEGLKSAFTPRAHFICCRYNAVNRTSLHQKTDTTLPQQSLLTPHPTLPGFTFGQDVVENELLNDYSNMDGTNSQTDENDAISFPTAESGEAYYVQNIGDSTEVMSQLLPGQSSGTQGVTEANQPSESAITITESNIKTHSVTELPTSTETTSVQNNEKTVDSDLEAIEMTTNNIPTAARHEEDGIALVTIVSSETSDGQKYEKITDSDSTTTEMTNLTAINVPTTMKYENKSTEMRTEDQGTAYTTIVSSSTDFITNSGTVTPEVILRHAETIIKEQKHEEIAYLKNEEENFHKPTTVGGTEISLENKAATIMDLKNDDDALSTLSITESTVAEIATESLNPNLSVVSSGDMKTDVAERDDIESDDDKEANNVRKRPIQARVELGTPFAVLTDKGIVMAHPSVVKAETEIFFAGDKDRNRNIGEQTFSTDETVGGMMTEETTESGTKTTMYRTEVSVSVERRTTGGVGVVTRTVSRRDATPTNLLGERKDDVTEEHTPVSEMTSTLPSILLNSDEKFKSTTLSMNDNLDETLKLENENEPALPPITTRETVFPTELDNSLSLTATEAPKSTAQYSDIAKDNSIQNGLSETSPIYNPPTTEVPNFVTEKYPEYQSEARNEISKSNSENNGMTATVSSKGTETTTIASIDAKKIPSNSSTNNLKAVSQASEITTEVPSTTNDGFTTYSSLEDLTTPPAFITTPSYDKSTIGNGGNFNVLPNTKEKDVTKLTKEESEVDETTTTEISLSSRTKNMTVAYKPTEKYPSMNETLNSELESSNATESTVSTITDSGSTVTKISTSESDMNKDILNVTTPSYEKSTIGNKGTFNILRNTKEKSTTELRTEDSSIATTTSSGTGISFTTENVETDENSSSLNETRHPEVNPANGTARSKNTSVETSSNPTTVSPSVTVVEDTTEHEEMSEGTVSYDTTITSLAQETETTTLYDGRNAWSETTEPSSTMHTTSDTNGEGHSAVTQKIDETSDDQNETSLQKESRSESEHNTTTAPTTETAGTTIALDTSTMTEMTTISTESNVPLSTVTTTQQTTDKQPPSCGIPSSEKHSSSKCWLVQFQNPLRTNSSMCVGSYIESNSIITSASCLTRVFDIGMTRISMMDAAGSEIPHNMVRDFIVHEEYRTKGVKILLNDIGLVRMEPGSKMSSAACALCLPKSDRDLMDRPCNKISLNNIKSKSLEPEMQIGSPLVCSGGIIAGVTSYYNPDPVYTPINDYVTWIRNNLKIRDDHDDKWK
ncbi:mucin-22-like isoform X2 [Periplaneta americana]